MNPATQRARNPRLGPFVYPYQYWYSYHSSFEAGCVLVIDQDGNYALIDDEGDQASWSFYGPELPPLYGPRP